jgi:hypothetical protein
MKNLKHVEWQDLILLITFQRVIKQLYNMFFVSHFQISFLNYKYVTFIWT